MATITLLRNGLDENGRPRRAGDTFDCSATYADLLVNDNRACYADGQQGVVVRYKDGSLVSGDGMGLIIISEEAPSNADGRPDGTIYIKVGA